jgi:hypothetical protein
MCRARGVARPGAGGGRRPAVIARADPQAGQRPGNAEHAGLRAAANAAHDHAIAGLQGRLYGAGRQGREPRRGRHALRRQATRRSLPRQGSGVAEGGLAPCHDSPRRPRSERDPPHSGRCADGEGSSSRFCLRRCSDCHTAGYGAAKASRPRDRAVPRPNPPSLARRSKCDSIRNSRATGALFHFNVCADACALCFAPAYGGSECICHLP